MWQKQRGEGGQAELCRPRPLGPAESLVLTALWVLRVVKELIPLGDHLRSSWDSMRTESVTQALGEVTQ